MQENSHGRGHAYLENKTIVQVSQKLRALETEYACNKYLFRQQIRLNWFGIVYSFSECHSSFSDELVAISTKGVKLVWYKISLNDELIDS